MIKPRWRTSRKIGDDLGLRAGNWSFAIVADFTDTDAYRGYDLDEIARVQFEVP